MLASATITPLLGTMKPDAAKAFYRDVLGLEFVTDDGFALVFNAKTVDDLTAKGVIFARFGFFVQDERGVWSAPDGTKVAWFHDPDLNLLSVVQHA
jgi:catechol 2,3-dioxygenase-like lactoylglutathione lyase family enzyme